MLLYPIALLESETAVDGDESLAMQCDIDIVNVLMWSNAIPVSFWGSDMTARHETNCETLSQEYRTACYIINYYRTNAHQ